MSSRLSVRDIAPSTHLGQSIQPFHVAVLGNTSVSNRLRLVLAALCYVSPSKMIRIVLLGQPFNVVGILVARQTTVHRLPEKAHQSVLHVTTAPTLLQTLIRRLRQSQRIIQLAAGQQSGPR